MKNKFSHNILTPVLALTTALMALFLSTGVSSLYGDTKLTPEERDWLDNNRDKLIMYYDWKFPPLEFNSHNNEFEGLGADVIGSIEKRLGVKFKKRFPTTGPISLKASKMALQQLLL